MAQEQVPKFKWSDWKHSIISVAALFAAVGVIKTSINGTFSTFNQYGANSKEMISNIEKIPMMERNITINRLRTQAVEDHVVAAVWESDTKGRYTYINISLGNLFGMSPLDATQNGGNGWLNSILPSDRDRVYKTWRSAVENMVPYEDTYQLKNGKFIQAKGSPYLDENDDVLFWAGTCVEINSDIK